MAKKNKKIVRYRRPLRINIGMIIFALIFVYMAFYVYQYMAREKVQPYEVTEGSIVNDKSFTGIILRQETTEYAAQNGFISYFVREGRRAANGAVIYFMDETGEFSRIMEESDQTQNLLTEEDLINVKKELSSFGMAYSNEDFSQVYDVKYSLDSMVMEYANFNSLSSQELLAARIENGLVQVKTPASGIISYSVDGFESLDETQISEAVFDRSQYTKTITKAGEMVEQGSPVYKVITDENWSVIFPLSQEDAADLADKESLKVHFPSHDMTLEGNFSIITGTDGASYGKLSFDKYMLQFASERYVDFRVIMQVAEGLKIPISAVTQKNFYLVPIDYLTTGGDSDQEGFNKEVYSEAGTSVVFVPATIYYETDEYYYIDTDEDEEIHGGDYLVKPDSADRYQVGPTASLQGVYNINRGYSVFKQIEVLSQNDEFYTVQKGTSYGLNVYDHIVLNASVIEGEDELIYQ